MHETAKTVQPPSSRTRMFGATAMCLVVLAMLLRLHKIGAQELWVDEAYSYLLAATPAWFGPATWANNTPPLYHFALRGWMTVAGENEMGLRLLSAVFGVLFIVVLIWMGRDMFSPSVGLWAGGFATIEPRHHCIYRPRGQLLLYYLGRLGHRWEEGLCRNKDGVRRFSCRFIPRENEQTQLIIARPGGSSLQSLVGEVAAVTDSLPPSIGTLWLVFQSLGRTPDGPVLLDPDARLIEEVERLGSAFGPSSAGRASTPFVAGWTVQPEAWRLPRNSWQRP